jgi:hypothetical protein
MMSRLSELEQLVLLQSLLQLALLQLAYLEQLQEPPQQSVLLGYQHSL